MARSKRKTAGVSGNDATSNGSDNSSPAQTNEFGAPSDSSFEEKNRKQQNCENLDNCFQSIARAVWEVHRSVQSLNRPSLASGNACSQSQPMKNPLSTCAAFAPQPPANPTASFAAPSPPAALKNPSLAFPSSSPRASQASSTFAAFPATFAGNNPPAPFRVLRSQPFVNVPPTPASAPPMPTLTSCPMFTPSSSAAGCGAFATTTDPGCSAFATTPDPGCSAFATTPDPGCSAFATTPDPSCSAFAMPPASGCRAFATPAAAGCGTFATSPDPGCSAFATSPASCPSSRRFSRSRPSSRRHRCYLEAAPRSSCGLFPPARPPSACRPRSRSSRRSARLRPRPSCRAFLDVGETPPACPSRPRPSPALCPSFAEDCDALAPPPRACRPRPSSFLRPHPSASASFCRRPRPSSAMCPPPAPACPPAHACATADPCGSPSYGAFRAFPGRGSGRFVTLPDACGAPRAGGCPSFGALACPPPARSSCDVFAAQAFPPRCPSGGARRMRPGKTASSTFCAIPSSLCAVSAAYEETFRPLGKRLLRAAERGQCGVIRELLDAGADPNYTFGSHWTPLHKAARKCHAEVVSLLLLRGADLHLRTTSGFTALHIAAYNDYSGQCVQLLIDAGSDVNCKNCSGRTPLHYAAESGNVPAVKKLLFAGANRTIRNRDGHIPFDVAKSECIRRLLCY